MSDQTNPVSTWPKPVANFDKRIDGMTVVEIKVYKQADCHFVSVVVFNWEIPNILGLTEELLARVVEQFGEHVLKTPRPSRELNETSMFFRLGFLSPDGPTSSFTMLYREPS